MKHLVNNAYHPLHAGVVYDICEHDALCISEQGVFDGVYSLVRCVSWVPGTLCLSISLASEAPSLFAGASQVCPRWPGSA